jgi:hypothetical protein
MDPAQVRTLPNHDSGDQAAWRLLTLCAHSFAASGPCGDVERSAGAITDWDKTCALAEHHGIGPLLYTQLKNADSVVPPDASRQLRALYLRHRRANQVRLQVLAEILGALDRMGIEATVLKGPALIALVYRDPALRPISDLDLLVPARDVVRAQLALRELGFRAPLPESSRDARRHHLPAAVRVEQGVQVQVEVHRDAFLRDSGASLRVNGHPPGAIRFEVCGQAAFCFAPEEVMWHLCRHMHWARLIWMTDIVGFAERFAGTIDWARVARCYPFVKNALALIHCIVPLSEPLRRAADVAIVPAPRGIGEDYRGWPATPLFVWDGLAGRCRFVGRTLNPPEWWLSFYQGTGTSRSDLLSARQRHLAMLLRCALRHTVDRIAIGGGQMAT